jgi:hypothetical protein
MEQWLRPYKFLLVRLSRIQGMPLLLAIMASLLLSFPFAPARAFMESEDQQFAADIAEAKARAQDFQKTLDRIEREEKERESAGYLLHDVRVREEELNENVRLDYVRERNNRPNLEEERERLEIADNKEKEKEAQVMEANRRGYIQKRDRVRSIIERDAYINEKKEYGL